LTAFRRENERLGKEQYLVPYLMCSHPGSSLTDAIELAEFLRDIGYHPEQVQEFIPTPGSLSTAMYYTGLHPLTGSPFCVPRLPGSDRCNAHCSNTGDPKIAEW